MTHNSLNSTQIPQEPGFQRRRGLAGRLWRRGRASRRWHSSNLGAVRRRRNLGPHRFRQPRNDAHLVGLLLRGRQQRCNAGPAQTLHR